MTIRKEKQLTFYSPFGSVFHFFLINKNNAFVYHCGIFQIENYDALLDYEINAMSCDKLKKK